MKSKVLLVREGVTLDLALQGPADVPKYGHPDGEALIAALVARRPHGPSGSHLQLLCREPGHEDGSLYLSFVRGSYYGSHHDGRDCGEPAPMTDEHRNMQAYCVRAAISAGLRAETEVSLALSGEGSRTRSDVVVYGDRQVAFEVQHSQLTAGAAVQRNRRYERNGMHAVCWVYDNSVTPAWADHVVGLDTSDTNWAFLPAEGSVKVARGILMPRHGHLVPHTGFTLDQVVVQVAQGKLVTKGRFLVPALFAELQNEGDEVKLQAMLGNSDRIECDSVVIRDRLRLVIAERERLERDALQAVREAEFEEQRKLARALVEAGESARAAEALVSLRAASAVHQAQVAEYARQRTLASAAAAKKSEEAARLLRDERAGRMYLAQEWLASGAASSPDLVWYSVANPYKP